MSLIVPNAAELIMLALILDQDVTLCLYSNDETPDEDSVLADFDEVAGGGYASKTLASISWTIATVAGEGVASYAQQEWTFTGAPDAPGTVYGYFVKLGTDLLWAERFDIEDPLEPTLNHVIRVTPKFLARSIF